MSRSPVVLLALAGSTSAHAWMGSTSDGSYRWTHSEQSADPDAPVYNFTSLPALQGGTNPGQQLTLGDDAQEVFTLGGTFRFHGVDHTAITVCANGVIAFGSGLDTCAFRPERIPAAGGSVDGFIAPMWADFDITSGGEVWVFTDATTTTVHWEQADQFGSPANPMTFQVVLYHQSTITPGEIVMHYELVDDLNAWNQLGDGAVIGVEDATGAHGAMVFDHQGTSTLSFSTFRFSPCVSGADFDSDGVDRCMDCTDFSPHARRTATDELLRRRLRCVRRRHPAPAHLLRPRLPRVCGRRPGL
jgi:hypothetical protein